MDAGFSATALPAARLLLALLVADHGSSSRRRCAGQAAAPSVPGGALQFNPASPAVFTSADAGQRTQLAMATISGITRHVVELPDNGATAWQAGSGVPEGTKQLLCSDDLLLLLAVQLACLLQQNQQPGTEAASAGLLAAAGVECLGKDSSGGRSLLPVAVMRSWQETVMCAVASMSAARVNRTLSGVAKQLPSEVLQLLMLPGAAAPAGSRLLAMGLSMLDNVRRSVDQVGSAQQISEAAAAALLLPALELGPAVLQAAHVSLDYGSSSSGAGGSLDPLMLLASEPALVTPEADIGLLRHYAAMVTWLLLYAPPSGVLGMAQRVQSQLMQSICSPAHSSAP